MSAAHDDVLHGMTANAFTSVSLDPLLVAVCVDRGAGMHDFVVAAGGFAVSILAAEHEDLSRWFASPRRPHGQDQFDGVAHRLAATSGAPVLDGAAAWLDCRVHAVHDGGDHSIVVGAVAAVGVAADVQPLVWLDGAYGRLA